MLRRTACGSHGRAEHSSPVSVAGMTPSVPSRHAPSLPTFGAGGMMSKGRALTSTPSGLSRTAAPRTTSLGGAGNPTGLHLEGGSHATRAPQLPSQRKTGKSASDYDNARGGKLSQKAVGPPNVSADAMSNLSLGGGLPTGSPAPPFLGTTIDYTDEELKYNYTFLPLSASYPGLKRIHDKPPIYIVENFLTADECKTLIEVASPLLQRSKTHAAAGSEATKGRTSLTCHLSKSAYPCPVLLQKIQALTNKPYGHMELPQVARYASSQRYVEHYDGVDPHTEAGRSFCASGGQRVATVLVYINDVPDGGATRFKRLDLEVKPVKGNALIFFPGFMNGELDTEVLHAGMPAVDTKWVSQVWIRQSFREDGQPSSPVPIEEQSLIGPLHKGIYQGLCIAGNDVHEADMTFDEAQAWADKHPECTGFTYEHPERYPSTKTRVWFKAKLEILYNETWWSYSTGRGM